jgi:hypothetical protein
MLAQSNARWQTVRGMIRSKDERVLIRSSTFKVDSLGAEERRLEKIEAAAINIFGLISGSLA